MDVTDLVNSNNANSTPLNKNEISQVSLNLLIETQDTLHMTPVIIFRGPGSD
ncbi:10107_t:CDS:2 [Entrophospora sp. SA101]|nr:10107_t:CDS:2 [Entrophospora sp. SA101]